MTNQQGAPEALRPIQRFNNIVGLMNPEARGLYVRYEDHVAALVEAQQPAPSAAEAEPEGRCAHYLPCECAPEAREGCVSWRKRKPSPTPQADSQPAPEYVGNGMFKGETIQKAAEHWANWCDVRCLTGLSEFLRVVAATPAFWTPEEIAAAKESAKKFEPWLADADRAARKEGGAA